MAKKKRRRRPGQQAVRYREGDAVRVKPGTAYPDVPELDIGGWQGRVTDLTGASKASELVIGLE